MGGDVRGLIARLRATLVNVSELGPNDGDQKPVASEISGVLRMLPCLIIGAAISCATVGDHSKWLLTSEYSIDSTLSPEDRSRLFTITDDEVMRMGMKPAVFHREVYSHDSFLLAAYYLKEWEWEGVGQAHIKLRKTDWFVLETFRTEEFYLRDTLLTGEERALILAVAEEAAKEAMTPGRSYKVRIYADDSSYAVYFSPHPNPRLNAKGEEVIIVGGVIQVTLLKNDLSVVRVRTWG